MDPLTVCCIAAVALLVLAILVVRKENMSGYGTISGLYFNNNGNRYCFHNPYDPPGYMYCGVSSKVVQ